MVFLVLKEDLFNLILKIFLNETIILKAWLVFFYLNLFAISHIFPVSWWLKTDLENTF